MDLSQVVIQDLYFDAGENGCGSYASSLLPGADCPANVVFMAAYFADKDRNPQQLPNVFCIFEKYAWGSVEVKKGSVKKGEERNETERYKQYLL
ncbi:unnamed protein product [Linum trigynum]|uniref:Amine oxidase n=1 Tax=Linum trigynum TaxID=586398 RepID=A0AAV2FNR4_9ROSI